MKKKRLSKGLRRHIRQEKARIRREVLDLNKQEEQISNFCNQLRARNLKMPKPSKSLKPLKTSKSDKTLEVLSPDVQPLKTQG